MIRKAFVMTLKPGVEAEYARRHNPIWPEVEAALKAHGVHNYSIFLEPGTTRLFAYAEVESEELWGQIAATEACRAWWHHMQELMLTNADASPVAEPLGELFHLD